MSEHLIERKRFGAYDLYLWSDGLRLELVDADEGIEPKYAAESLRQAADWLMQSRPRT